MKVICLLLCLTLSTVSSNLVKWQYPSVNPCIIFNTELEISIIAVFPDQPEAKREQLDTSSVLLNTSYCDNGNSSQLDFILHDGVGLSIMFTKDNVSVLMEPSFTFLPGIVFRNFTNDTSSVMINSQSGKKLPPAFTSYSCFTGDTPIVMSNGSSLGVSYHGIISITQLEVQAFYIENGTLSPGESCDSIPISSGLPPVTPKPGSPPVKSYIRYEDGVPCIIIHAGLEFEIPYTSKGTRAVKIIGVPDSATVVGGSCNGHADTFQTITLGFYGNWELTFFFTRTDKSHSMLQADPGNFGVYLISLQFEITDVLFPDADKSENSTVEIITQNFADTPLFQTTIGNNYRCDQKTVVDLEGMPLDITNLQLVAFNTVNSTDFNQRAVLNCAAPSQSGDHDNAGLIVGVIIGVFFVVMVFVGIIYYRRKSKSGYDQVY